MDYVEFLKGFDKCPICDKKMDNINEVLIKKVRGSAILKGCPNCDIIVGRFYKE